MSLIKSYRHNYCAEGGWSLGTYYYKSPKAVDRGEGQGTAEVNGAGPSAVVVEKDVVGLSAMVVESDCVGP